MKVEIYEVDQEKSGIIQRNGVLSKNTGKYIGDEDYHYVFDETFLYFGTIIAIILCIMDSKGGFYAEIIHVFDVLFFILYCITLFWQVWLQ